MTKPTKKPIRGKKRVTYATNLTPTSFMAVRRELREAVTEWKRGRACEDCRNVFDPICMDFDHLPGQKKIRNIAAMVSRASGQNAWQQILAEIVKCDLVCANCHRLRTQDRLAEAKYTYVTRQS